MSRGTTSPRRTVAATRAKTVHRSRHLIERGDHREAVFWITATFARCHTVLAADTPDLRLARLPAFREAVADLGVISTGDLLHRAEEVIGFLPRLRQTAEEILAAKCRHHRMRRTRRREPGQ
ncbi:hypothetical protein ACFRQM_36880 [Streptomyces sp. NPDC056831]|uniref:hypothetical protein n=1 Tax=Streptomyces sp. NPDC056831 TaxID=3345954 RepID=UPI00369C6524